MKFLKISLKDGKKCFCAESGQKCHEKSKGEGESEK